MEKPEVKTGEIIKIGKGSLSSFFAIVSYIDINKIFSDIKVVYLQDGHKGTEDEVNWNGKWWELKEGSFGITLDDSNEFVQILKNKKHG